MNQKRIDLRNFVVSDRDNIIFDTNIWIYIAGPEANAADHRNRDYSRLLRDIIATDAGLFYTEIVISEFINRALRTYCDVFKNTPGNENLSYKAYRATQEFSDSFNQIRIALDLINNVARPVSPINFTCNLGQIVDYMSTSTCDYNDILISETAKANNLLLATHDYDMSQYNCDIITYNRRLLI